MVFGIPPQEDVGNVLLALLADLYSVSIISQTPWMWNFGEYCDLTLIQGPRRDVRPKRRRFILLPRQYIRHRAPGISAVDLKTITFSSWHMHGLSSLFLRRRNNI